MENEIEIPRRNQMNLWVPAEKAIYEAMQEIEKMGADINLTDAIILLHNAKHLVSDYVESNSYIPKNEFVIPDVSKSVCIWCKKNSRYKATPICKDCFDAWDK